MAAKEKLKKWLGYPLDTQYRAEIEECLAEDAVRPYETMAAIILAMQIMMIVLFLLKPGGPFATPRRAGYFFSIFC